MKKARKAPVRFAVCIKNKGYEASLGEDYGYAASRFFAIDLPKALEKVLLQIAS